jgi:hypothetical protein
MECDNDDWEVSARMVGTMMTMEGVDLKLSRMVVRRTESQQGRINRPPA